MKKAMTTATAATFAALILLLGCGSESPSMARQPSQNEPAGGSSSNLDVGSGSCQGTVQGQPLEVNSAAAAVTTLNDTNFLIFVLSSQSDYCTTTSAGQTRPNHHSLVASLFIVNSDGTSAAIQLGSYQVVSDAPSSAGSYANAAFNVSDGACKSILTSTVGSATSGTIIINALTATHAAGSYTILFGTDTVKGTFSAPLCQGLAAQTSSGNSLTCTQGT